MTSRTSRTLLMAAVSSFALAGVANAQAPETGQGDRRVVDVITVTAQQREESVQDVPLSIGAYDEGALESAGVQDIKDLISIAPGLMVTSTQAETITTARIRGVGTVGDNFGLESSVGVYIDGVFRARNGVGFGDLGELERIEVLRGPQGTLFGKNTSAGVLNIVTAEPEFTPGGSLEYTYGEYNYNRIAGHVTGPLVEDKLAFRLFGVSGQRDGFTDLVIEQGGTARTTESETQDYYSFRGQLLWTPNAQVEGRIIADYTERDELCCSAVQWDYTAAAAAFVNSVGGQVLQPADPDRRLAFANRDYQQDVEDWGISAEFDFDLDLGTLTSVTAFRNWSNQRSQDIDYSSADIAYRDFDNNFTDLERFSQEFRLQGVNGDLDWLVGAFYSREDLHLGDAIQFGTDWEPFLGRLLTAGSVPPLGTPAGVSATLSALTGGAIAIPPGSAIPGGTGVNQDIYDQTATSWALFTHNTYQLTDRFALTGGLRYTREEKEVTASFSTNSPLACAALEGAFGFDPVTGFVTFATGAGLPASTIQGGATAIGNICLPYARSGLDQTGYDQERSDEEVSGTLRATYDLTDEVMTYAGYSRGFKAGGFNLDRQFNGPIDPALGYTDVDTSFAPEIIDAYEAGFKSTLAGGALQLNANLFYQEIQDFQLNTFNGIAFVVESVDESTSRGVELDFQYATPVDGLDISGGYAYVDATYDEVNTGDPLVDAIEGKNLSLSPEHFLTGQVIYERPITANLNGLFSIDARYVSEYNTGSDLDPEKVQDAFTLVNARLGVSTNTGWSVELWGRNLTDETYAQVAIDAFAQGRRAGAGTSNDPRATASYDAFLGAPRTWGITVAKEW
ncbi:TonB-dependent receptor [Marinicauda algicola]|uniref:TonB-dependent receptor n=1 Tax=Marinicauda algicola TaxID=2029849 RepID=A0A4S2H3S8_9PROT|nr:TonB-dependent receptor [Marinicauda algicola]TGY89922.1 TonB-dependent receptor [Marinicauda algicola]